VLAAVSAAFYLALALGGDLRAHLGGYLAVHAFVFVLYLVAVTALLRDEGGPEGSGAPRDRRHLVILASAIVFRVILLPATPTLSDDIWRYIWEGGVQLQGINPYRYAPSAPELEHLRDAVYEQINYKELPAIYPPLMQWVFAVGALLGRTAIGMKTLFVAADIGLIVMLGRLAAALGIPKARVVLYAWNPLVVMEVAGSGHNDSLALALLIGSTIAIIGQRPVLSMVSLGMSAVAKLFPFVLAPLFARKVKPLHLMIVPLLAAACYLPYLSAGTNLLRSPREYAERWRHNDSLFSILEAGVDASGISPVAKGWADEHGFNSLYTQPHMIARLLAASIALVLLCLLVWKQDRSDPAALSRSIFVFTGAVLLLQPVLHPWYLLWIAPWLVLFPSPAWLALTCLAPLSYTGLWWARWVEYIPFFLLLWPGPPGLRGQAGLARAGSLWRGRRRLW